VYTFVVDRFLVDSLYEYVWVGLMVFLVYTVHVFSCGDYEL